MNRKILLIKNPISGKKASNIIFPKIVNKLENIFDIEVIESKFKGHIEEILFSISIKNYDCCCILGGDGSFHEAINGLIKRQDGQRIPLGLIPCGSGNSLARDLNILDINSALNNLIKFDTSNLDIVKIANDKEDIYSFNITGWGMVATVGQKAEKFRWLGTNRYTILSLFEIFFKKTNNASIEYIDRNNEKHTLKGEYMFAAICNTIHTGKGMKIAPKAKLNDGLLDLVLIKDATRFKLIKLMLKLFSGQHIHDSIVEYIKITKLKITAERNSLLIDGEIKGFAPFNLSILPNEITIIN